MSQTRNTAARRQLCTVQSGGSSTSAVYSADDVAVQWLMNARDSWTHVWYRCPWSSTGKHGL